MKKFYLIFLISSCLSLLYFSFLNHKKDEKLYSENINNLEELIDDSIKPYCSYNFNKSYINSSNYENNFIIVIPKSRKWSKNLLNAFTEDIEDTKISKAKYKKRFNAKRYFKTSNNEICE